MDITLEAASRGTKKKGSRAVRRTGNVPCILYGHHVDPVAFQVPEPSLKPLIYTNETHLVKITLDGDSWDCILKDIAFHPVTDRPLHADFQVLQAGEEVTLPVPVQYVGTPLGQKNGGIASYLVNELEVRCLPKNIPGHIDVDVSLLKIGDSINLGALELEGVEFTASAEMTLVRVALPRRAEVVEDDELLDEEEGAEGETEGTAEDAEE